MMRKKTTEEFIADAIKVHGDLYDYSLVDYRNSKVKVKIICSEHGVFEQIPNDHLTKHGCAKCGGSAKHNRDEFIENAIKVHGTRYDYSLIEYTGNKTKVKIVCKEHGIFEQVPNSHLSGFGCPKCTSKQSNTSEFIEKSIKVHGDLYDYSLVDYTTKREYVKIVCKEHGPFSQTPSNHLAGYGCIECGIASNRKTQDEFICEASFVHDNLYDYSLVDYKSTHKHVKIVCSKHGTFPQTPSSHLNGAGCPKCSNIVSKPEIEVFEFIKTLTNDVRQSNRKILKRKELDIYCASDKIAIEFNGMYWHSDKTIETHGKSKYKHLHKTLECDKLGIKLFHIFENEWRHNKDIWKSILTRAFNKAEFKRVTHEQQITIDDAQIFFKSNSFEKARESAVGYYSDNELIAVLSDDILVYKLNVTSNIKPKKLKFNARMPESVLEYELIEMSEPNALMHKNLRIFDSTNIESDYANRCMCIWDCGYKLCE
ncbi:MAG: hypothetical protein ACRC3J_09350 [Culicoidibacterales bacterium]